MRDFANALESYLVPTQEGFFKNLFKKKTKPNPDEPVPASMQYEEKRNPYWEKNQKILERIESERPDEIAKERESRLKAVKDLLKILNNVEKKFKKNPDMAGFKFTTKDLKTLTKYPNVTADDFDDWGDCLDFFTYLLPSKQLSKMEEWEWLTGYDICVIDCDIWDWNNKLYKGERLVRDYEQTKGYHDMMEMLMNELDEQCKGHPHLLKSQYGGDWDDGPIDIKLKPSPRFITLASKYGYKY